MRSSKLMPWKFSSSSLYSMIGRSKTSKENKINKTEQQSIDNQQYDVMAR
jgi:hypothetical protein